MKNPKRLISIALIVIGVISASWSLSRRLFATPLPVEEGSTGEALEAFAAIRPIDAHVHVFKNGPAFQAFLERLHLTLLDIVVVDDTEEYDKKLEPQLKDPLAVVHSSHGHVVLCTTFDPFRFSDADFEAETIKQLNQNFAEGAIAVKVWKNIGMELKTSEGKFVMPDDPKFEPIYRDIAKQGKTLLMHMAEPDLCWKPLDPADPLSEYYKQNPQWYMYNKPDRPSKATILNARDHVLAEYPKLRVVGVHLGSMEMDLDEIARHLDRYPNFAVDTAARMEYLMTAPHDKVRAFLIKYQARVLYGTDLDQEVIKEWEKTYAQDWRFLATDQTIDFDGKKIRGLKLPQPVLRKIYRENAIHWIPGIVK